MLFYFLPKSRYSPCRIASVFVTFFSSQYSWSAKYSFASNRMLKRMSLGFSTFGRPILAAKVTPHFLACIYYSMRMPKSQHLFPNFPGGGCHFFLRWVVIRDPPLFPQRGEVICPKGAAPLPKRGSWFSQRGHTVCPKGAGSFPRGPGSFAQKARPVCPEDPAGGPALTWTTLSWTGLTYPYLGFQVGTRLEPIWNP